MSATGGTVGMTLAQIKPGQLKATLPGVRQMQLQQIPIAQQQQRKNAAGATGRLVLHAIPPTLKRINVVAKCWF